MSDNPLLAAAHLYRGRGWRVIQIHSVGPDGETCSCNKGRNCTSKGKHPIVNEWQKTEAYSAADLQALWEKRPRANVGLAVGKASGFWVLDIDPGNGGLESMTELVDQHGKLPVTFTVKTGSGGFHYYFTLPDFELRNSADRVGKGIDTRADGGQVVAAPSTSDKGPYRVIKDVPLAPAPDWLLEMARKTEVDLPTVTAGDLPKPEDLRPEEWERLNYYAERAVAAECERLRAMSRLATKDPSKYQGEPWNQTTFEVACSLLEFQNSPWCSYNSAWDDVTNLAPRDEDFTIEDIVERFESAQRTVGDKARPAPEDRRREPDILFDDVPDISEPTVEEGDLLFDDARLQRTYFTGDKGTTPDYVEMAHGVFDGGPIGWGQDHDFWSYDTGVWTPDHYVVQHRLIDILDRAYKAGHVPSVRDIVQRHARRITGDPLEPLMNFRNGMLDWKTLTLVDHDPAYGSTVQLGCDWDADATCPVFDEWLSRKLQPDYVTLAWEMIGYLIRSGNPKHRAFLLYGVGGSGKSTLLRLITELLGEQNIAAETLDDLNNNKFRTASLFGKIANIAGDIDATYQEHTATFKRITGEDTVTAEHKNMPPFRFVNWAVPVFSANKIPGSADVTDGYLRRWVILRFLNPVAAKDRIDHLEERFFPELPGIAAKAVRALTTMEARGDFYEEGEVLAGKEEFAEEIDQVRKWLKSGDPIMSPGSSTPLIHVYSSYSMWAERSGQRKVRESEFVHRLGEVGFDRVLDQGVPHIMGVTVHSPSNSMTMGDL